MKTPKQEGFHFPAEWHPHQATWLSWPHNQESWPGKIESIFSAYTQFVKELSLDEEVHVHVSNQLMEDQTAEMLDKKGTRMRNIFFHHFPTNDAWCRDHGPSFVIHQNKREKAIINWGYNAWGNKYPHDLDNQIPEKVAEFRGLRAFQPGIVMEGGSIEVNGEGALLTTTACLLHPNRNPGYNQVQLESILCDFYGVDTIFWLGEGIEGDDTDGHVDDITRFVAPHRVVTVIEENRSDANYEPLQKNLRLLKQFRWKGKPFDIIELPMPSPVYYHGQRLPASYANFYIANKKVIVPTFRDKLDEKVLDILQKEFTDRTVIGIDSLDIIWGLGSWHCLSQQEPSTSSI